MIPLHALCLNFINIVLLILNLKMYFSDRISLIKKVKILSYLTLEPNEPTPNAYSITEARNIN